MKKIFKIFSVTLLSIFLCGFLGVKYSFAGSDICGPCCKKADCIVGDCFGSGKDSNNKDCTSETKTISGKDVIVITAGQGGQCQDPNKVTFCPISSYTQPQELINKISGYIFMLALIVAPLMILLGGFYMLTAAGDPSRANQGKQIITWAIIGLAVILFAKAFISIITSVIK